MAEENLPESQLKLSKMKFHATCVNKSLTLRLLQFATDSRCIPILRLNFTAATVACNFHWRYWDSMIIRFRWYQSVLFFLFIITCRGLTLFNSSSDSQGFSCGNPRPYRIHKFRWARKMRRMRHSFLQSKSIELSLSFNT